MIRIRSLFRFLVAGVLLCSGFVAGCHAPANPDDKDAVYKILEQNKLYSVQVAQDREKGVITLSGIVGDNASKAQAQTVAQNAAPGYSIANQIQVNLQADLMKMAQPGSKAEANTPARR